MARGLDRLFTLIYLPGKENGHDPTAVSFIIRSFFLNIGIRLSVMKLVEPCRAAAEIIGQDFSKTSYLCVELWSKYPSDPVL